MESTPPKKLTKDVKARLVTALCYILSTTIEWEINITPELLQRGFRLVIPKGQSIPKTTVQTMWDALINRLKKDIGEVHEVRGKGSGSTITLTDVQKAELRARYSAPATVVTTDEQVQQEEPRDTNIPTPPSVLDKILAEMITLRDEVRALTDLVLEQRSAKPQVVTHDPPAPRSPSLPVHTVTMVGFKVAQREVINRLLEVQMATHPYKFAVHWKDAQNDARVIPPADILVYSAWLGGDLLRRPKPSHKGFVNQFRMPDKSNLAVATAILGEIYKLSPVAV